MRNEFDVIILGGGFSGAILAAVLARHGHKTLIVDAKEHPRFAIGEATIPQTTMMMRAVADRFDVPEIGQCSTFEGMHEHVTSHCGVKTNFGFVYQREMTEQRPDEATQNIIPHLLIGYDCHWFRQDLDAHLFHVAIKYGAQAVQNAAIEDIEIDAAGARVGLTDGREFKARFVVDGSGFRSALANKFELKEDPCRFKTHSRSIFNHFVDVPAYDEFADSPRHWSVPQPWHDGTMHHIFDGGWIWVIPFGNHPESNSPLCSVGLSLDSRRYPKPDDDPADEFYGFIAQFPGVAKQFETAKAVREWVSTGRLQYSSKTCIGERFCLTAHAAHNIDALFSRGMSNTIEGIYVLLPTLMQALADDDFSLDRFAYFNEVQQRTIDYNDRLVNCSYVSFRDFDLWNAWYRLWSYGGLLNVFRIKKIQDQYKASGDVDRLDELNHVRHVGSLCPNLDWYEEMFDSAATKVEEVEQGVTTPRQAADHILALFDGDTTHVPPMFGFSDANRHYNCVFDFESIVDLISWGKSADEDLRALCF